MKIGIDATICSSSRPTGLGIYAANLINALSQIHNDIVVWTVDDTGMTIDKQKLRKVMQTLHFMGNKAFQVRPFWIDLLLPKLLKQEGVDVLFSVVPSALSRSPVPHVVTVLDLIPLTFPGEISKTVYWNYKYRIPAILNNAAALVTISDHTKTEVVKHFNINPNKIHTTYLGYDSANFRPHCDLEVLGRYGLEPRRYLLYVGNASPRKNLITLVKAYAQIASRISHKLVLCGSKTKRERRQILEWVSQYKLEERVQLLDYVSYADLPVLYTGAALFTYVSLSEGFGLPILEAMACGTPVLCSNTTSIPEVARDAAVLLDPRDYGNMAHVIARTVLDERRLQELSAAGLQKCKQFSWGKTAQQVLCLLKSVAH
jgi:glycosyltransferase involved in cell wall biosynthesis